MEGRLRTTCRSCRKRVVTARRVLLEVKTGWGTGAEGGWWEKKGCVTDVGNQGGNKGG